MTGNRLAPRKPGKDRRTKPIILHLPWATKFLPILTALLLAGCGSFDLAGRADEPTTTPHRIVSTAPSITEIVFAVGAGDRLVGVSKFCEYPPESRSLPKVGGLLDPAGEAVLRLDPDLVIILEENDRFRREMGPGGIPILAVDHKHIQGIIDSIKVIGRVCGQEDKGKALSESLGKRLRELKQSRPREEEPPRVLISVGRDAGSGSLGKVHIAGDDGYFSEMIRLAGGLNAYPGRIRYPAVSVEGILRMNPDIIIDLVPGFRKDGLEKQALFREWDALEGTAAWQNGEIHIVGEDFWTLPGPRFIKIIEEMALILGK